MIFDVNENLLDLTPMRIRINQLLGSTEAFDQWFPKLIQFSMVETLSGSYSDFGQIGAATLEMTAQSFKKSISKKDIKSTLAIITQLDPHPEVLESLKVLKKDGFRLVALTNGGKVTLQKQMKYSGLITQFDALYSIESVKKFKPHPDAYQHVLKTENCQPEDAMLIAVHAWDVVGAQSMGLQTAFIQRPGKYTYPNSKEPTLRAQNLNEFLLKIES
mgnify:CR=1 FL=1